MPALDSNQPSTRADRDDLNVHFERVRSTSMLKRLSNFSLQRPQQQQQPEFSSAPIPMPEPLQRQRQAAIRAREIQEREAKLNYLPEKEYAKEVSPASLIKEQWIAKNQPPPPSVPSNRALQTAVDDPNQQWLTDPGVQLYLAVLSDKNPPSDRSATPVNVSKPPEVDLTPGPNTITPDVLAGEPRRPRHQSHLSQSPAHLTHDPPPSGVHTPVRRFETLLTDTFGLSQTSPNFRLDLSSQGPPVLPEVSTAPMDLVDTWEAARAPAVPRLGGEEIANPDVVAYAPPRRRTSVRSTVAKSVSKLFRGASAFSSRKVLRRTDIALRPLSRAM